MVDRDTQVNKQLMADNQKQIPTIPNKWDFFTSSNSTIVRNFNENYLNF